MIEALLALVTIGAVLVVLARRRRRRKEAATITKVDANRSRADAKSGVALQHFASAAEQPPHERATEQTETVPRDGIDWARAMIQVRFDLPRIARSEASALADHIAAALTGGAREFTVTFPACGPTPFRRIDLDRSQMRDLLRDILDAHPNAIPPERTEMAFGLRGATPPMTPAERMERMRASQPSPLADGLNHPVEIEYEGRNEDTVRRVDLRRVLGRDGVPTHLQGWCHLARAQRMFRLDRVLSLTDLATGEVIEDEEAIRRWAAAQTGAAGELPPAPRREPRLSPSPPVIRGWPEEFVDQAVEIPTLADGLSRRVTVVVGRKNPETTNYTITAILGGPRGPSRLKGPWPGWSEPRQLMISQIQRLTDHETGETVEGAAAVRAWALARVAEFKSAGHGQAHR